MIKNNVVGGILDQVKLQSPAVSSMKYLDISLHNFTKSIYTDIVRVTNKYYI